MVPTSTPRIVLERAIKLAGTSFRPVNVVVRRAGFITYVDTSSSGRSETTSYSDFQQAMAVLEETLDTAEGSDVLLDYTRTDDIARVESLFTTSVLQPEATLHLAEHVRTLHSSKDAAHRDLVLLFAQHAPLAYGHWGAWKWLLKQAMDTDDIALLKHMLGRVDEPFLSYAPAPFQGMPFLGKVPDIRTVRYMERRARRYLSNLGERDPDAYFQISRAILEGIEDSRPFELQLTVQPLSFDILYGRSSRFSRSPYSVGKPVKGSTAGQLVREEQFPGIWDQHLATMQQWVAKVALPDETREFAARVLIGNGRPVTLDDQDDRVRLTQSDSALLRSLATQQRIEIALNSARTHAGELGRLYRLAETDTRRQIDAIASDSAAEWLVEFARGIAAESVTSRSSKPSTSTDAVNIMNVVLDRVETTDAKQLIMSAMLDSGIPAAVKHVYSRWRSLPARDLAQWIQQLRESHSVGADQHISEIRRQLLTKPLQVDELIDLLPTFCEAGIPDLTMRFILETPLGESPLLQQVVSRMSTVTTYTQRELCEQLNRALLDSSTFMPSNWPAARSDVSDRLIPHLVGSIPSLSAAAWDYVFSQDDWLARNESFLHQFVKEAIGSRNLHRHLQDQRLVDALATNQQALKLLVDRPVEVKQLPEALLSRVIRLQTMSQTLDLIAALNDNEWHSVNDLVHQEIESSDPLAFWHALSWRRADDRNSRLAERLASDDRFAAQFHRICTANLIRSIRPESPLAVQALCLGWLVLRDHDAIRHLNLLPATIWHPIEEVREWGADALAEVGVHFEMIVTLLEDTSAEMNDRGEELLSSVSAGDDLEVDTIVSLLRSYNARSRKRAVAYLTSRSESHGARLTASILSRIGEPEPVELREHALDLIVRNVLPSEGAVPLVRRLLQGTAREKRIGMTWIDQNDTAAISVLLETAREGNNRMQDWAYQRLTALTLAGNQIPGFEVVGAVEDRL